MLTYSYEKEYVITFVIKLDTVSIKADHTYGRYFSAVQRMAQMWVVICRTLLLCMIVSD